MKKTLTTIFLIIMILTVVGVVFVPQQAEASCVSLTAFNPGECITTAMAWIGNQVLILASYFISITGVLLNMAIILTLNIKAVYQATPAIEQVWVVIRNISSIFIIFGLLYASITTIIGVGKTSVKQMVGNIIMAGLLINFSLFFAKIMIDTSNLVSMQFYRAIAPEFQNVNLNSASIGTILGTSFSSGGISNIFQQSLKIQKIYKAGNGVLNAFNAMGVIMFSTYMGIILTVIAGLSFLAAGMAFIVRLALLLLFMGFAPLYFVGMVFPTVRQEIKPYFDKFIGQLIFMPAYLLLTYVALKFISGGGFFEALNSAQGSTTGNIFLANAGLAFQYVIALVLINVPLMVALKLGAIAPKWAGGIQNMAQNWTKKWAKGGASWAGKKTWENTGGRVASRVARSESFQNFAASDRTGIGELALRSTRSVAQNYDRRLTERTTERINFAGSLDRRSARNYAARISQSIPARMSAMGAVGRADRVAAARILRTRRQEIETDLNRLNSEFDRLTAVQNPNSPNHRALNPNEQARWNIYQSPDRNTNEIFRAEDELREIDQQITSFETRVGAPARVVERRNY